MLNYTPAPEQKDLVKIKEKYYLFIGGKWVPPAKGNYFKVINPATEEILSEVPEATEEDVNLAMEKAQKAYEKYWKKMPPIERGKYLYRIGRAIQEYSRKLAIIETLNNGKPIRESRDVDIPLSALHFLYYAGWADKIKFVVGENWEPYGVCGQVIPWNFPLLMAAWKIAPALACGNTVVLKPAETTPLTALTLAEIIEECDLPPGVVNIITGAAKTGALVIAHPLAKKIAFTGSTEVGKIILKSTAGTNKSLTLELGGKAPNIIFEDAPIYEAIEGVINGIFFNQGHVCCAGSRLLVEESIKDTFIEKLKERMQSLIVGDPMDKNTDIGAINSKMQLEKINSYIKFAKADKLEIYQTNHHLPEKGYWCRPTLIINATPSNRVAQEEIFGPVLTILTFRTIKEAIEISNNTFYGLSAGVWTIKGSKAFLLAKNINAGVIWINTYNKFDPSAPFGGYKESGFGREGGLHGLFHYIQYPNYNSK